MAGFDWMLVDDVPARLDLLREHNGGHSKRGIVSTAVGARMRNHGGQHGDQVSSLVGHFDEVSSDATSGRMGLPQHDRPEIDVARLQPGPPAERRQRRRSWVFHPEELFETADVCVDVFVGERLFGHVIVGRHRSRNGRGQEPARAHDESGFLGGTG